MPPPYSREAPGRSRRNDSPIIRATSGNAPPGPAASPESSPASAPTNRREPDSTDYRLVQAFPFDSIRPVYNPTFAAAHHVDLNGDLPVLGIELDGEAKAYPLNVLRFRKMVNDELAGIPILATFRPICHTGLVHDRRLDGSQSFSATQEGSS